MIKEYPIETIDHKISTIVKMYYIFGDTKEETKTKMIKHCNKVLEDFKNLEV